MLRVFISYSHDSEMNRQRLRELADQLRPTGSMHGATSIRKPRRSLARLDPQPSGTSRSGLFGLYRDLRPAIFGAEAGGIGPRG